MQMTCNHIKRCSSLFTHLEKRKLKLYYFSPIKMTRTHLAHTVYDGAARKRIFSHIAGGMQRIKSLWMEIGQ